jgi:hypothetical protein
MADTFVLDYGDGRITVEMDDGDRDADAYKLISGDRVTVRADEFVLNTGLRRIIVETDGMPFDPLDDQGYPKLEVGDVVRVQGNMDTDLLEGRELVAESIVKLSL